MDHFNLSTCIYELWQCPSFRRWRKLAPASRQSAWDCSIKSIQLLRLLSVTHDYFIEQEYGGV